MYPGKTELNYYPAGKLMMFILPVKKLDDAYDNYNRCLAFVNASMNAYSAANEIFAAANIISSKEMLECVIQIYASYRQELNIEWFISNSPLDILPTRLFNIFIISESLFYDSYSAGQFLTKQEYKNILDSAIFQTKKILVFYTNALNEATETHRDLLNLNKKFAWTDRLGHSIIDYIDISIGGSRIDRHYGIWLDIWYELAGKKNMDEIYMKMIGQVPELTNFDRISKPEYLLYIPLQFWFNRFNGLSLPLVALQYHQVCLTVKLRTFQECGYLEPDLVTGLADTEPVVLDDYLETNYVNNKNNIKDLEASLLIDYIFLDAPERKKFAQSSHEYLIEQLQIDKIVSVSNIDQRALLDFYHPCKELIWVSQKQAYLENLYGDNKCQWTNYSLNINKQGNPFMSSSLSFNGYVRFDRFTGDYFNYVQPYAHHSNTPSNGINVYSFALKPEEHQPSGSCNLSRISKSVMDFILDPAVFINDTVTISNTELNNKTDVIISIFTQNINVLRIISGMAALAYE
jgi:hypothetical protein